jgi:hypothetical protein
MKNIVSNTLITQVPFIDGLNKKSIVNENNEKKQTNEYANKLSERTDELEIKKVSYFKSKTNFKQKENEILDYYLNNHIEYLDLEKYEQHFKDYLVKQNIHFSNMKGEIKKKKKVLQELDSSINEVVINHLSLLQTNSTSLKNVQVQEESEDVYTKIINTLNAQM